MSTTSSVVVNRRYQISLPSNVHRELGIEAGDRLLVMVQDEMIILLPQPKNYVQAMRGLHREIWQGTDTKAYLNEERAVWSTLDED